MKYSLTVLIFLSFAYGGCAPPTEPDPIPPRPVFTQAIAPPSPEDSRIFADVDPLVNAIWLQWYRDPATSISGYAIYRSLDSALLPYTGRLKNGVLLAMLEPSNSLFEKVDTSYRDTTAVHTNVRYWYQIEAYNRSATNVLTFSTPTDVNLSTSFKLLVRPEVDDPKGPTTIGLTGLTLRWIDPSYGNDGPFQIIVERTDSVSVVFASKPILQYQNTCALTYPNDTSATPLVNGASYRWRVKKLGVSSGASSAWQSFSVSR